MEAPARQTLWILAILLGLSLGLSGAACKDDSSSCSGGNGKKCDIFSYPVTVGQEQARLHFTAWQITEGDCPPPHCSSAACTELVLDGLFFQLDVIGSAAPDAPPHTRCRYQIDSAEGEPVDLLLSEVSCSSASFCCDTGPRSVIGCSWSAYANGVELAGAFPSGYRLPASFDGGVTSADGAP